MFNGEDLLFLNDISNTNNLRLARHSTPRLASHEFIYKQFICLDNVNGNEIKATNITDSKLSTPRMRSRNNYNTTTLTPRMLGVTYRTNLYFTRENTLVKFDGVRHSSSTSRYLKDNY